MEPSIRASLANHFREIAAWRRRRVEDDLRDARNLRTAAALEELADYVLGLPEDHPVLQRLAELTLQGNAFVPGQQTAYEIGRFRFYNEDATLDGFLAYLVEQAEADRGEHGRFGGRQVPGDEPWE